MKRKYDSTDIYYLLIYSKILRLLPVTGLSAAMTFTFARLAGYFPSVSLVPLVCFDSACLLYFAVAHILRRSGIIQDDGINHRVLFLAEIVITCIIILQWNLITYIFPTRDFWGYAPMFVLLSAFMFHSRVVLTTISGLSFSIAISWLLNGEQLLPDADEMFAENLILRIVALVLSFSVIYILTLFAERFTQQVKQNDQALAKQNEELRQMSGDIVDFTADIIEQRDATSGSHVKRLKNYARLLAMQVAADYPEYGLDEEKIDYISHASALHDVGKIGIPDNILLKPGRLTPEEFEVVKTHTTLGALIVDKLPDSIGDEYKKYCREICLYHHEKYDGSGYPNALAGEEIPISAQIVSAVDCYDALTSVRPYKTSLPSDVAVKMILEGQCGVFSEKILRSLSACRSKFELC